MNWEAVWQIVKEDLGIRKFPQKWCLESWHMTRINVGFTVHLIFYAMQRRLLVLLPVMKRGVFNTTRKQNDRACSGKHRIHLGRKKHACLGRRSRPCCCVFLRSQGDSSLLIHCTTINSKSTVLFGSADKVTGMCSEEKTRTLAW